MNLRTGEQHSDGHLARNPAGLVPVWQDIGVTHCQSLAIIEHLDEAYPDPPLLPGDARQCAAIREIALMVAADIHPFANLRVLNRLTDCFVAEADARSDWVRHWVGLGLGAIEACLRTTAGHYAVGDKPTPARCYLIPQLYAARRFDAELTMVPIQGRVEALASPCLPSRLPCPTSKTTPDSLDQASRLHRRCKRPIQRQGPPQEQARTSSATGPIGSLAQSCTLSTLGGRHGSGRRRPHAFAVTLSGGREEDVAS